MKYLKFLFAITITAISLVGCKYSFIVPEDVIDPDDPNAPQVSFANEIQPIFDDKCVFCHNGSRNPNLADGNSYSSLKAGYINLDSPEGSLVYTKVDPNGGGSHVKMTAGQSALLLTWIKQGANDN